MNKAQLHPYHSKHLLTSRGLKVLPFFALLISFTINALAQPVNIVVTPPATTTSVGQTFTVTVAADFTGATAPLGVDDIEIHLAFDNTKLQVTSIIEEPTVAAFTTKVIALEANPYTATNAAGQINYHATTTLGIPTADFDVLSVTFLVIAGDGTSAPLTLLSTPPLNETRAGGNGNSVLGTVISSAAYINAVGCTPPTATISVQSGAAVCNAQAFNVVLDAAPVGVAPFDISLTGPNGITTTYNDISVGGIITSFIPPTENIWPSTPSPLPASESDNPATLGVKFSSSVSGFVKGVRFFSPNVVSGVAGAYTGQLWAADGSLLASGTFTGVTTDSWQELLFTTPVLIAANTTYIASYHTTSITYVATAGGLNTGATNGTLTAPDNATAGGNGVYAYGGAASFPANSNGTNYWADVIFSPSTYTINLTNVKDANECSNSGVLQTLNITTVDCSTLPVNIVINPPATTTTVGQTFTVVVASDFTGAPLGLDDIELHLAFDNTKLQVTSITEEPTVAAFTTKVIPLEANPYTATNASGQINYHATTTTGIPTADFDVLSITFTVIGGAGTTTPLTLRRDPPTDDTRAAGAGSSILSNVINATVTINPLGCTPPTVTISAPESIAICDGQPFNLLLDAAPVGLAPFDITIAGPGGTATYNDISVGGIITTFTPPTERIWPAAPAPTPFTETDAAVTLGVKFTSSVAGFVKGVRFFSPNVVSAVAGAYTGQLWAADGTLLASGTFTSVTTSSWQELLFASPVLITANTTYIASYHTTDINYVGTPNGLNAAVTTGSLTALDNATAGGNGVYTYGATPVFPTSFNGSNYWADVIFSPNNYTFTVTGVKDANECSNSGTLQTLNVTAADCSEFPVTIAINPPATTTSVGQTFVVTVASDFAEPLGLDDIELHLSFDNTKLQVTSITEEPTVAAFTTKVIPLEANPYTATNAAGQINYHATTTTGIPTTDFNVLSITFTVIAGEGTTTPLTLRRDPPTDDTRAAGNGSSILAGVTNATVTINPAGCITPPTATISVQTGAAICDNQPFNLVLDAAPIGLAPFDITLTTPAGVATYNDIAVGGVITTFTPPTESLWPATPAPVPPTESDNAVTLGIKFRSSVAGFVTGVRFFSPNAVSAVPGTYTGQLWSAGGSLLASGIFVNVTTSSWQELIFASPVLIDANTNYIASYHTADITYVGTANGLNTGVTSGSLTAPDNASSGGNGLYAYGPAAAFPNTSNGSNYWADVIFTPNTYAINLTGVKDANECANTGALQTLNMTSVDCSTLPVTFLNFSATPKDKAITLKWATSTEINNKGFEIQRSGDGSSWSVIGFVNGLENSTSTVNYSFVDENLSAGRYYYRLKQIDIDLRFVYSATVSAVLGQTETFTLEQNYPNPFSNQTVIRFSLPRKAKVNLSLFDMHGRLVKVLVNESRDSGTHAVTLNSGLLTSGLYFYKIQTGEFSAVKKLTIQ